MAKKQFSNWVQSITLPVPILEEERKITQIFIFTQLCGDSKGFKKVLKAIIKPFEAPQRHVKIKMYLNFFISRQLSEMHGTGRVKVSLNLE